MDSARQNSSDLRVRPSLPSRRTLLRAGAGLAVAAGFAGASLLPTGSAEPAPDRDTPRTRASRASTTPRPNGCLPPRPTSPSRTGPPSIRWSSWSSTSRRRRTTTRSPSSRTPPSRSPRTMYALRRRARRPSGAGEGRGLARGQLELRHPEHRGRARGLDRRAGHVVHGRHVQGLGGTDGEHLRPAWHPRGPRAHHRPQRGPRSRPHRSGPALGLGPLHGVDPDTELDETHGEACQPKVAAAESRSRTSCHLFSEGGDTIRVSLSDRSVEQIKSGCHILASARETPAAIASCPGRAEAEISRRNRSPFTRAGPAPRAVIPFAGQ